MVSARLYGLQKAVDANGTNSLFILLTQITFHQFSPPSTKSGIGNVPGKNSG